MADTKQVPGNLYQCRAPHLPLLHPSPTPSHRAGILHWKAGTCPLQTLQVQVWSLIYVADGKQEMDSGRCSTCVRFPGTIPALHPEHRPIALPWPREAGRPGSFDEGSQTTCII